MHSPDEPLLNLREFHIGPVSAFAFLLGGDTAYNYDGVAVGSLCCKTGEVSEYPLAELCGKHGERTVTPDILDSDVIALACLDFEFLVCRNGIPSSESAGCGTLALLDGLSVDLEPVAVVGRYEILEGTGEIRLERT